MNPIEMLTNSYDIDLSNMVSQEGYDQLADLFDRIVASNRNSPKVSKEERNRIEAEWLRKGDASTATEAIDALAAVLREDCHSSLDNLPNLVHWVKGLTDLLSTAKAQLAWEVRQIANPNSGPSKALPKEHAEACKELLEPIITLAKINPNMGIKLQQDSDGNPRKFSLQGIKFEENLSGKPSHNRPLVVTVQLEEEGEFNTCHEGTLESALHYVSTVDYPMNGDRFNEILSDHGQKLSDDFDVEVNGYRVIGTRPSSLW